METSYIFFDFSTFKSAIITIAVILTLATTLAFSGIGLMSSILRILSLKYQRSIYDKCANQIAYLGLILGWSVLIISRVWIYFTLGKYSSESLAHFLAESSWILLSLAVLLFSIYYALKRILANLIIFHSTIGTFATILAIFSTMCIIASIRLIASFNHPNASTMTLESIFPTLWYSSFWNATIVTIPLSVTLPACFSCFWILLRRKYDDFGRDYYNKMLSWCATWAQNAWLFFCICQAVFSTYQMIYDQENTDFSVLFVQNLPYILIYLAPIILWNFVSKTKVQIYQIITIILGLLLTICAVAPYYKNIITL